MQLTLHIGTMMIDLSWPFWILVGYFAVAVAVFPIATLVILFRIPGSGGIWECIKVGAFVGLFWFLLLVVWINGLFFGPKKEGIL